jgi:long-chain acyl-CoA synthetase
VLHEGRLITESDLITHCRGLLAAFKVPSRITFRHELPRTLVGKVLRRALLNEEAANAALTPMP